MKQIVTPILYNQHNSSQKHKNQLRNLYNCLYILHTTQIRGFRTIFGKPVNGQRTSSNGQTAKNCTSVLYLFKYKALSTLNKHLSLTKPIFIAEYINLFWQHQWLNEWVASHKLLQRLPIYLRKTNYIDIQNINLFYIYTFYNNPFKLSTKVRQKRKKVVPKNKFATGFPFGFSLIYSKQLIV